MAFGEKIPVYFEASTKGFNNVRADIASADGAIGKMKAGASSLGGVLKANLAASAMAAGTALVAMGAKAVSAFQDAALSAGKFADATGLAVEDASRWIEVAGDVGVEASTIQGAFTKMNKSIADGKDAWSEYGVAIIRTKDGLVDSNATMVQALARIGAIEDPTLRAKAAQEVFGKSYTEVAELMSMSANDLEAALGGVSDAKVINETELAKAKKFRESMDNLRDKLEDLAITLGESLVPQLEDLAEQAVKVAEVGIKLKSGFDVAAQAAYGVNLEAEDMYDTFEKLAPTLEAAGANVDELFRGFLTGKVTLSDLNRIIAEYESGLVSSGAQVDGFEKRLQDGYTRSIEEAGEATYNLSDDLAELDKKAFLAEKAMEGVTDATEEMNKAYSKLTGKLDNRAAWDNVIDSTADLMELIDGGEASWDDLRRATDEQTRALADFIVQSEAVPEELKSTFISDLDQGKYDYVRSQVEALERSYQAKVNPVIDPAELSKAEQQLALLARNRSAGINLSTGGQLPKVPKFDSGGVMPGPIGQHSLALVAGGETVLPTHKPGVGVGGGITVVVNGANPEAVIAAIKRYERNNGRGWRS